MQLDYAQLHVDHCKAVMRPIFKDMSMRFTRIHNIFPALKNANKERQKMSDFYDWKVKKIEPNLLIWLHSQIIYLPLKINVIASSSPFFVTGMS